MGHGQSKRNAHKHQTSSNYAPRSSSSLPASTRSGKTSPKNKTKSLKEKHNKQPPTISTVLPPSVSSTTQARTSSHSSNQPPSHTTRLQGYGSSSSPSQQQQRASYAGERSVPSRQFSLNRQTSSGVSAKHAQIEKYFTKYKDREEDAILAEGMEKFCVDLAVDPTEFIVLVLAWKFEASQMCRFTREEFMNGCQKMCAHDAKSLKERFPELLMEARDGKNFKDLYNFTFSFGLDHTTGQRSLPMDMAIALWGLVFNQHKPEILQQWFDFLNSSEVRGISRDTWNMFLPFVNSIKPDLSNYDESEAWPSLFDDFVEGELEKVQ